jgi:hypothetical protein
VSFDGVIVESRTAQGEHEDARRSWEWQRHFRERRVDSGDGMRRPGPARTPEEVTSQ